MTFSRRVPGGLDPGVTRSIREGRDAKRAGNRTWPRVLFAVALLVASAAAALFAARDLLPRRTGARYLTPDGAARAAYVRDDPDLGYSPVPGARVRAVRRAGDRTIYDVLYTIDADGHRLTHGDPAGPDVLFFGCSFTFGEGLVDADALPEQLSAALGRRAHVVNLGFHGYGPHQMLRALEIGRVRVPAGAHVIYQGLSDHVRRAAGKAPWDTYGPLYEVDGDGIRYAGRFHARPIALFLRTVARLVNAGLLPQALVGGEPDAADRERTSGW